MASVFFAYVFTTFLQLFPDKLFAFLANSSGEVTMIMYIFIAFSHLYLRKKTEKENPGTLKVENVAIPLLLTYPTIAVLFIIFVAQAFIDFMKFAILSYNPSHDSSYWVILSFFYHKEKRNCC